MCTLTAPLQGTAGDLRQLLGTVPQFQFTDQLTDCVIANNIIADPEGKATNLDAQVAEHLYICMFFCLYVYMSVTVSYLAHGLKIVSVAIPMASSCSYLYNVLNSQFRLLPSLRRTCGSQFGVRLRQVSTPFSAPDPRQNPSGPWGWWAKWRQLPERVAGERGSKAVGSENPLIVQFPDAGYTLAI